MPLIRPLPTSSSSETPLALLHISSREVPPGGLSFKIEALAERAPLSAWVGPFNDSDTLTKEVNRRELANGLSPSTLMEVEHQICTRLPPGYCRDSSQRRTTHAGSGALGLADVISGTKALVRWFLHGSVEEREIIRRTYICNACPQNVPIAGCSGCAASSLHSVMNAIVVKHLPSDAVLQSCAICKCSLPAKVRMRLDDLLPSMSKEQRALLPEKCWIIAEPSTRDNDPRV